MGTGVFMGLCCLCITVLEHWGRLSPGGRGGARRISAMASVLSMLGEAEAVGAEEYM